MIGKTPGAYQMQYALEINFALWGMMLCAAVQVAQRFEVHSFISH
jgi:hypothetical protein